MKTRQSTFGQRPATYAEYLRTTSPPTCAPHDPDEIAAAEAFAASFDTDAEVIARPFHGPSLRVVL